MHCTNTSLRGDQFWIFVIEIMQEVGDDLNICVLNIISEYSNLTLPSLKP